MADSLIPEDIIPPDVNDKLTHMLGLLKQVSAVDGGNINEMKEAIRKFGKENSIASKYIERLLSAVKDSKDLFKKYESALDEAQRALHSNQKGHRKLYQSIEKTMLGVRGMSKATEASIKMITKSKDVSDDLKESMVAQLRVLHKSIDETKKANVEDQKAAIIKKKLARETEGLSDTLGRQGKRVKALGSDLNGLIAGFSGTSISVGGAVKSVLTYNQSMFDLSRTYQTFGKGTKDIQQAFRNVGNETTFSKQQFADFANEIASGYSGINPTITQIGNFAGLLQSQFGPNVDIAKEKAKSLLEVFAKYPPAMNEMLRASDLMKKFQAGDTGAGDELKKLQAALLIQAEYNGASIQQRNDILQLTSKTDDKTKGLLKTNKEVAGVQQKSADALLKLGQSLEPSIRVIAGTLDGFLKIANQLPNVIMLSAGAFGAVGMIMKSQIISSMDIVPDKLKLWVDSLYQVKAAADMAATSINSAGAGRGPLNVASPLRTPGGATTVTPSGPSIAGATSTQLGLKLRPLGAGAVAAGTAVAGTRAALNQANPARTAPAAPAAPKVPKTPGKFASGIKGAGPSVGIMTALSAFMTYKSTKSMSKAEGFTDEESSDRAMKSAGASAGGAIVGGIVGSFAGPLGTILGSSIGGMIGTAWADNSNENESRVKAAKEAAKAAKDENKAIKDSNTTAGELTKKWEAMRDINEYNMKLLSEQKEILMGQADILNSMFVLSADGAEKAYSRAFKAITQEVSEASSYVEQLFQNRGTNADLLEQMGITPSDFKDVNELVTVLGERLNEIASTKSKMKLDISALDAAGASVEELKNKRAELNAVEQQSAVMGGISNDLAKNQQIIMSGSKNIAESINKVIFERVDKQVNLNSLIEARLGTERSLMEAANFGMGASIKMMQKQVNLSYDNIKTIQKSLSLQGESLALKLTEENVTGDIGKNQKDALATIIKTTFNNVKNAESQEEWSRGIEKGMNDMKEINLTDKARQHIHATLNQSVEEYQKKQTKSLEAQKKIYDLTKDIREGYLDALREMSSGAGEFEKIIGTHEMGVTQLMDAVKNTTGEHRLNTMALGGYTGVDTDAGKARTGGFAKYTIHGADFGQISDSKQAAMNTDIDGYGKSRDKVASEARGTASGPTAGVVSSNSEHASTIAAYRESDAKRPGDITKGFNDSIIGKNLRGVNTGVKNNNAPGQSGRTQSDAIQGGPSFGAAILGGSTGQTPARTNTDSPARVSSLPTTPGMDQSMSLAVNRDEKFKDLMNLGRTITQDLEKLNKEGESKSKKYEKLIHQRKKVVRALNSRVADIEKEFGMISRDAGGTTYQDANLSSFFGRDKPVGAITAGSGSTVKTPDPKDKNVSDISAPKANPPDLTPLEKAKISNIENFKELQKEFEAGSKKEALALEAFIGNNIAKVNDPVNDKVSTQLRKSTGAAVKRYKRVDSEKALTVTNTLIDNKMKEFQSNQDITGKKAYEMVSQLSQETGKSIGDIVTNVLPGQKDGAELLNVLKKHKIRYVDYYAETGEDLTKKKRSQEFEANVNKGIAKSKSEGKDTLSTVRTIQQEMLGDGSNTTSSDREAAASSIFENYSKDKQYQSLETQEDRDSFINSNLKKGLSGMDYSGENEGKKLEELTAKIDIKKRVKQKSKQAASYAKWKKEKEATEKRKKKYQETVSKATPKVAPTKGSQEYFRQQEYEKVKKANAIQALKDAQPTKGTQEYFRQQEYDNIKKKEAEVAEKKKQEEKMLTPNSFTEKYAHSRISGLEKRMKGTKDPAEKEKIGKALEIRKANFKRTMSNRQERKDKIRFSSHNVKEKINEFGKDTYNQAKRAMVEHYKPGMSSEDVLDKFKTDKPERGLDEMVGAMSVYRRQVDNNRNQTRKEDSNILGKSGRGKSSQANKSLREKIETERKKQETAATKSFMQSVVGDGIKAKKGQSSSDAFLEAAYKKHGTRGEKVWESESEFKEYENQREKASKMYGESKGDKPSVQGGQRLRVSKETKSNKVASAAGQAMYKSQEVQTQREAQGMAASSGTDGGGDGGVIGKVLVELKLIGDLDMVVKEMSGALEVMGNV
jgi:hypothetical protein